jgi:hypothetical protein
MLVIGTAGGDKGNCRVVSRAVVLSCCRAVVLSCCRAVVLSCCRAVVLSCCRAEQQIWEFDDNVRKWNAVVALEGHEDSITDVAWAPNLGRSFHLIATASRCESHARASR